MTLLPPHDLGHVIHDVSEIAARLSDLIPVASTLPASDLDALQREVVRLWNITTSLSLARAA